MPPSIDLTGQKFGKLIIIRFVQKDKWGHSCWLCKCDCDKEKIICDNDLKSGHTKSCGCLAATHGHTMSITYKSWEGIVQRCTNPNHKNYNYYGGRGITLCKRWRKFTNFLGDMGERPGYKYTLDRINNDKGYYKSNCQWATRKQQQRNRRDNRLETFNGKTQLLIELAEKFDINFNTLRGRIDRLGWSVEKALTTPVGKYKQRRKKK